MSIIQTAFVISALPPGDMSSSARLDSHDRITQMTVKWIQSSFSRRFVVLELQAVVSATRPVGRIPAQHNSIPVRQELWCLGWTMRMRIVHSRVYLGGKEAGRV